MKRAALLLAVVSLGCATLAPDGRGDVDLPSALSGPFRALKRARVCDEHDVCTGVDELPAGTQDGVPKYPGIPASRSPSLLVRGSGVGDDLRVVMYVAHDLDAPPSRLARMESDTARDFSGTAIEVLTADAAFEGGSASDPSAIEVDGVVWLFYAVADTGVAGQKPGIARARSTDGLEGRVFSKDPGPVLTIDGADLTWESGPPRAPSVVRLPDGSFRMFFASGNGIGEAESADGSRFVRRAGNPVLRASAPVDVASLPQGVKPPFDDRAVSDPCADRYVTAAGRVAWRVLYTGLDLRGGSAIGFAGRFGDDGPLTANVGPMYAAKIHGNAPGIARFDGFALLFLNQDKDTTTTTFDPNKQQLGVAITPAILKLPYPE